jgi:dienelactone hydrolase
MMTLARAAGAFLAATAFAMLFAVSPASSQPAPTDVVETPLAGFPHTVVYRLPGTDARPVLVILGGAEGGDGAGRRFGPIFARMGYTAVGYPYYSPNWGSSAPPPDLPDLPGSFIDIRIDRLAELRDALKAIPGADTRRFGLFSGSKGSEFALIAASKYDWITAVAAYTPSDLVWEGFGLEMIDAEGTRSSFSFHGKPMPFMPYRGFVDGLKAGPRANLRAIHENGRSDHPDREAAARIPVENYHGALMLIAGERDSQWNSARAARNIAGSRSAYGLETRVLIFPDAGHNLAGGGTKPVDDPRSGGTPQADADARRIAWPQVVTFLSEALKPAAGSAK